MNKLCAVWIDHEHAQVVETREGDEPIVRTVHSDAEARHRTTGQTGVPLPGHLGCNTESRDRNRRVEELHRFYDEVIHRIPADSVLLILGPGEAKREFQKRLVSKRPRLRIGGTQTTSKLSEDEIIRQLEAFAHEQMATKATTHSQPN